jgi:hypothetical protein
LLMAVLETNTEDESLGENTKLTWWISQFNITLNHPSVYHVFDLWRHFCRPSKLLSFRQLDFGISLDTGLIWSSKKILLSRNPSGGLQASDPLIITRTQDKQLVQWQKTLCSCYKCITINKDLCASGTSVSFSAPPFILLELIHPSHNLQWASSRSKANL